jgi:hypothetical protein
VTYSHANGNVLPNKLNLQEGALNRFIDHTFILSTILFTVYSQLIMRWQVSAAGGGAYRHAGQDQLHH